MSLGIVFYSIATVIEMYFFYIYIDMSICILYSVVSNQTKIDKLHDRLSEMEFTNRNNVFTVEHIPKRFTYDTNCLKKVITLARNSRKSKWIKKN